MKRAFIFVIILLAILSVVNAISHQLQKRATIYEQCALTPPPSLLTVAVSPDPVVPGKIATYNISVKLTKEGSALFIIFGELNTSKTLIGSPSVADICTKIKCPTSTISTVEQAPVPANLPRSYVNAVFVTDSVGSGKNILGCAEALVGAPAPAAPKAIV